MASYQNLLLRNLSLSTVICDRMDQVIDSTRNWFRSTPNRIANNCCHYRIFPVKSSVAKLRNVFLSVFLGSVNVFGHILKITSFRDIICSVKDYQLWYLAKCDNYQISNDNWYDFLCHINIVDLIWHFEFFFFFLYQYRYHSKWIKKIIDKTHRMWNMFVC